MCHRNLAIFANRILPKKLCAIDTLLILVSNDDIKLFEKV